MKAKPNQHLHQHSIEDDSTMRSMSPSAIARLHEVIESLKNETSTEDPSNTPNCDAEDLRRCLALLAPNSTARMQSITSNSNDSSVPGTSHNPATSINATANQETAKQQTIESAGLRFANPVLIGVGAFGLVFQATDTRLNIPVAIKLLRPSKAISPEHCARFLGEAHATAQLSHPGIIRIFDTGHLDDIPYITCEFASGGSLRDWIDKHPGPLPPKQAAEIMAQVADAVQYAHSKLTLHRDLKPGNILLIPRDQGSDSRFPFRPVVADFGLSKNLGAAPTNWTLDRKIIGTCRYMSPEQADGQVEDLRTTTDIYSMGVILYQLVTGQVPFEGEFEYEILKRVRYQPPEPPRALQPNLSKDIDAVILKCLEKDPNQRYQTANFLRLELDCFLRGDLVEVRKTSLFRTAFRTLQHYPIATSLVSLLLATNFTAILLINKARTDAIKAANRTIQVIGQMHSEYGDTILEGSLIPPKRFSDKLAKSIAFVEEWTRDNGESEAAARTLALLRHYSSLCHLVLDEPDKSQVDREQALAAQKTLLQLDPDNKDLQFDIATSLYRLAESVDRAKPEHPNESIHFLELAIDQLEPLIKKPWNRKIDAIDLRNAIDRFHAEILQRHNRDQEAVHLFEQVVDRSKDLIQQNPQRPLLSTHSVFSLHGIANICWHNNDLAGCFQAYTRAEQIALSCWTTQFEQGWPMRELETLYLRWVQASIQSGHFQEAGSILTRWLDLHRRELPFATGSEGIPLLSDRNVTTYSILCFLRFVKQQDPSAVPMDESTLLSELESASEKLGHSGDKLKSLSDEFDKHGIEATELVPLLKLANHDTTKSSTP